MSQNHEAVGQVPAAVFEAPQITEHHGIIDRLRSRWGAAIGAGMLGAAALVGPVVHESPAYADSSEVTIGMPFDGKWAYSNLTTAACGPAGSQTSHPSCHETYFGDWSVDLYGAPDTTEVKLKATSTKPLTFSWDTTATGSCGETRRVKVFADGTQVGRVHFTHLTEAASTSSAPTNDMVVGKIANLACNPGGTGKHVHVEFDNQSNHSCYINQSTAANTAGISLTTGTAIGKLGSPNTNDKEACATVPSPSPSPTNPDTDQDGVPDTQDACPLEPGTVNGCPDLDGDGTANNNDLWPNQPGPTNNRGVSLTTHTVAGDFNGDGYSDVGAFYNYGNGITRLFSFNGSATGSQAPVEKWYSGGPGTWNWADSKVVAGDFNNDGKEDIAALYDQGGGRAKMHMFLGSLTGLQNPAQQWDSGAPNTWNLKDSELVAGDFNGDGYSDVGAFYNYGAAGTRIFTFNGSATGPQAPTEKWYSGAGNWEAKETKPVVADVNGDGKDDIAALYNYYNGISRLFTFNGSPTGPQAPVEKWYSGGPNTWKWSDSQLVAGDFNGDGKGDVGAFYDYSNGITRLFTFNGSATGPQAPTEKWYSGGPGTWNWQDAKAVAADANGDGKSDVLAFYNYGNGTTRLFSFNGSATGPLPYTQKWYSGPSSWDWTSQ